ncbi:hypothetical protein Tco_0981052 [Tanacetum coccineum]
MEARLIVKGPSRVSSRHHLRKLNIWLLQKLLKKMYCNNTRAISIANEPGITNGAKHYRIKVHYLHEEIELGNIKLDKVHTDDNVEFFEGWKPLSPLQLAVEEVMSE